MIHAEIIEDGILLITMDRPPANAIDQAMSDGLDAAFNHFEDDDALLVCIVTGAGERFFSAGWDLKEVANGRSDESSFGRGGYMGLTERWGLVKPVIAAVNGTAAGGGLPAYMRHRASPNRLEGPRAFVEKRPPRWTK